MTDKLWGGRFTGSADIVFARFNRSFGFDRRLFDADLEASRAHARALGIAKVLSDEETTKIIDGLQQIQAAHEAQGENYFNELNDAEDVHSFIETRLIALIGDAARRLHTGRSRNDQVATAMRIWLRARIDEAIRSTCDLQNALLEIAEANFDAVLPGYTHLQRAQPVLWAHWCLAYFEMLLRDRERFEDARRRTDVLPLGAAALAGTSHAIDRESIARDLGFASIARNSLDAVSDRDFVLDFTYACSTLMLHLSRIAEDLILYSSNEFGFIELGDKVATGSSLMPQKKNPDAMELVRGKTARVFGHHTALLTLIKGLPLAYNKDLQEDKEAAFDAFDTVQMSLQTTVTVLSNVTLRRDVMRRAAQTGYLNATELADYLVKRGMPFRTAHDLTGRIVLHAIEKKLELNDLPIEDLQRFSELIEPDVFTALSLAATLDSKSQLGGTARARVREALTEARRRVVKARS